MDAVSGNTEIAIIKANTEVVKDFLLRWGKAKF